MSTKFTDEKMEAVKDGIAKIVKDNLGEQVGFAGVFTSINPDSRQIKSAEENNVGTAFLTNIKNKATELSAVTSHLLSLVDDDDDVSTAVTYFAATLDVSLKTYFEDLSQRKDLSKEDAATVRMLSDDSDGTAWFRQLSAVTDKIAKVHDAKCLVMEQHKKDKDGYDIQCEMTLRTETTKEELLSYLASAVVTYAKAHANGDCEGLLDDLYAKVMTGSYDGYQHVKTGDI